MKTQRKATIKKLLKAYCVEDLLRHIAFEVELEANHLETVGAPIRAGHMREEVSAIRAATSEIWSIWNRQ